jgi:hypothetical protein
MNQNIKLFSFDCHHVIVIIDVYSIGLFLYSQTCVQRPPLGLKKSGRCSKVKAKWSLFTVCSYKTAISFVKLGLKMAVVDRWPLFRGGR